MLLQFLAVAQFAGCVLTPDDGCGIALASGRSRKKELYPLAVDRSSASSFESRTEVLQFFRQDRIVENAWVITNERSSHGSRSVKVTMRKGDVAKDGRERAELRDPFSVPLDQEIWYRVDLFLPNDFPVIENNLILAQIKQENDKNPLFSLRFNSGKVEIRQTSSVAKMYYQLPADIELRNRWNVILVHAKFSEKDGFLRAWINNRQFVDSAGKNVYEKDGKHTYFKFGLYRDSEDSEMTAFYDHYRRGDSLEYVLDGDAAALTKELIAPRIKEQ